MSDALEGEDCCQLRSQVAKQALHWQQLIIRLTVSASPTTVIYTSSIVL
jgi:hypothetical protein